MNSRNLKKKKVEEYRNIVSRNFKCLIKDLNHALKIILATGDKKFSKNRIFLMNDFFGFFFFLKIRFHHFTIAGIVSELNCALNKGGTQFNMKHSLKK